MKAKLPREFYQEIGRKGGLVTKAKGTAYYQEIGKRGGEATWERHGSEHFEKAGKKGGESVAALIRRGREQEGQQK